MQNDDEADAAWAHQQELEYRRSLEEEEMPNIGEMLPSKYLKKEDLAQPKLLTIVGFEKQNLARPGDKKDEKWILLSAEEKPVVLNSTKLNALADALGTTETDDMVGRTIVAYCDPNVMYAGKKVGGIALRAARGPAANNPPPRKQAAQDEDYDDNIPF